MAEVEPFGSGKFMKILEISKDFRGEKDHTRIQAEEVEWKEPAGMGR